MNPRGRFGLGLAMSVFLMGCPATDTPVSTAPQLIVVRASDPSDGLLDTLLQQLQQRASEFPNDGGRRGRLAIAYEINGFHDAAFDTYGQAVALAPKEAVWPFLLGVLALRQGRHDEALSSATKAAALAPQDSSAQLLAGWTLIAQRQHALAREALTKAAELGAVDQAELGLQYVDSTEQASRTGRPLRPVAFPDPYVDKKITFLRSAALSRDYGLELIEAGNVTRGMRVLEAVRPMLDDDPRLLRGLVEAYTATRHPEWAVAILRDGVARHPDVFYFNYRLGVHYRNSEELDAAARHLRTALGIDPRHREAREHLGIVLMRAGDFEQALEHLLAARTTEAYYQAGMIEGARTQWATASDYFGRAIRLTPTCARCYLYRGYSLGEMGDFDAAVAALDEARNHGAQETDVERGFEYIESLRGSAR